MASPYYQDNDTKLFCGDARDMSELEDGSVQCVVTSPPYWGLRKYAGVPDLIWGGDPDCDHEWGEEASSGATRTDNHKEWANRIVAGDPPPDAPHIKISQGAFCHCGAWRGGYGLEPTPEMYVEHTVEVLREVRRVLRDDGVVFWNLGDSYNAGHSDWSRWKGGQTFKEERRPPYAGNLKPKDLVLIPFRVALAAQGFATVSGKEILRCADHLRDARLAGDWDAVQMVEGLLRVWSRWACLEDTWVRSIIIWDKLNPMPESVRDRPTTSHEYIIMLTKSARYYWDAEAVRENGAEPDRVRGDSIGHTQRGLAGRPVDRVASQTTSRNVRTVWSFPSQPFPDAHFATFPEALPERCILAATPEVGCCEKCGAPWERLTESTTRFEGGSGKAGRTAEDVNASGKWAGIQSGKNLKLGPVVDVQTLGWQPTCKCEWHDPEFPIIAGAPVPMVPYPAVPSVVLDPFAGSCRTLWVAKRLGRRSAGYELSKTYCELGIKSLPQQALGL
ncbi:hypothetical protein LCGC14_0567480 [marine sediment metagenome]|uniref:site-specific DNA-methyltransferase (cytosine-N(4)-specific) n=1 Tax=marine sediment metagenome TaxID=412755 RepID=A0A0F9RK20_9ZZZZ